MFNIFFTKHKAKEIQKQIDLKELLLTYLQPYVTFVRNQITFYIHLFKEKGLQNRFDFSRRRRFTSLTGVLFLEASLRRPPFMSKDVRKKRKERKKVQVAMLNF